MNDFTFMGFRPESMYWTPSGIHLIFRFENGWGAWLHSYSNQMTEIEQYHRYSFPQEIKPEPTYKPREWVFVPLYQDAFPHEMLEEWPGKWKVYTLPYTRFRGISDIIETEERPIVWGQKVRTGDAYYRLKELMKKEGTSLEETSLDWTWRQMA